MRIEREPSVHKSQITNKNRPTMEEHEKQAIPEDNTEAVKGTKHSTAKPSKRRKGNLLGSILGGDILLNKKGQDQIPLALLLVVFGVVLVSNRYKVEELTKAKLAGQERINSLRESSIELQKRYQETIKISAIASRLDSTGVGITAGPPFEI